MKNKVIVISVSNKAMGGVASVVSTFMKNEQLNNTFRIRYFHSHNPKNVLIKQLSLFWSYLSFPFVLINDSFDVAHIHG